MSVDVVLGRQSPHRKAVEELVSCRPYTTLYAPQTSLAGLIARADLAIGAGGSTNWERIALRLPSLVVTFGRDQEPIAKALDHAGYLQFLGDADSVTSHKIRTALLATIVDFSTKHSVPALVDGLGAKRLVIAMMGLQGPIILKPAVSTDETLLLNWANDPQVRANSFSKDPIAPENHHKWFQKGLIDPNRLFAYCHDS